MEWRSTVWLGVSGGQRLPGPERPLLEGERSAVLAEADNPEVAVLAVDGIAIGHLDPDDGRLTVESDDLTGHREDLVRPLPLGVPPLSDLLQADERLLVGRHPIGGVLPEEPAQRLRSGAPPGQLV